MWFARGFSWLTSAKLPPSTRKERLGSQICHWTLYTYLENWSKNTTTNNSSLKTRLNHWVESRGIARGANLRRTPLHLWWRDKSRGRDRDPRKTVDHNYLRKCFEILLLPVEARSSHCCFKMATATDTRGNVVKMDVDFSSTVDELLPKCDALVKVRTGSLCSCSLIFILYLSICLYRTEIGKW